MGCGVTLSHFHKDLVCLMKWSMGAALVLVMSIDSMDRFDLTHSLMRCFQMQQVYVPSVVTLGGDIPDLSTFCSQHTAANFACRPHLAGYLMAWAFFSFVFCCCRGYFSGDLNAMSSCCGKLFSSISSICSKSTTSRAGAGVSRSGLQHKYMSINTAEDQLVMSEPLAQGSKMSPTKSAPQRTFSYPDSLEFNYFDPDNLPVAVQAYADCIFSSVQSLSAEIGFQVDNSRNQAEHLLMMITNETQRGDHLNPSLPPQRLHQKLFRNYTKWCESLGVEPCFTPVEHTYGKSYAARIEDMLIFLLVWGEAANLKHMPECLCFLYHKTMKDHLSLSMKKHFASNNVVFYPGYFLDMVVTPIYDVVSKSLKSGGDHCDRKTYDDFNEFFWSSDCFQYAHHHAYVGISSSESGTVSADDEKMTVSDAMLLATKTYIEKRSWLHPLSAFHRLFEWHVITFTILATISFHNALVWPVAYTLSIGSFIFIEINLLGLVWICLNIWTIFPSSSLTGPNISGYVLRLLVGYVILVYQAIYFHWAFRSDDLEAGKDSLRSMGDANFWWWQYLWLSFFSLVFYFSSIIFNLIPVMESYILSYNSDLVQAVLNICYPFSELYVGKIVHTSIGESIGYFVYWFTLIAFKLWFGYYYIVNPVSIPSIELYDDYLNFPDISFLRTLLLFFVWWFPHFMVYLIDMSIWFACWSSAVGGMAALMDRQGAVRASYSLRQHFMKLPFALSQKLLPVLEEGGRGAFQRSVSRVSTAGLPVMASGQAQSMTSTMSTRAKSSNQLYQSYQNGENDLPPPAVVQSSTNDSLMEEFLDVRSRRWVNFSIVWNEIVQSLRDGDLLSNSEMDILLFHKFDWLSKPVYLPLYQTAGRVETALHDYKNAAMSYHQENEPSKKILVAEQLKQSLDIPTWEAVGELWELVQWVLVQLMGPVHQSDVTYILGKLSTWAAADDLYNHMAMKGLPVILNQICNIAGALMGCINFRKKSPVVSAEMQSSYANAPASQTLEASANASASGPGRIKKSISTGFLSAFDTTQGTGDLNVPEKKVTTDSNAVRTYTKLQPFRTSDSLKDQVRDKIREDVRSVLMNVKDSLRKGGSGKEQSVGTEVQEVLARITFIMSMERGFLWSDVYASSQIDELVKDDRLKRVTAKINGLCKVRQTQIEPVSPEARRRIHFFVNSLFMTMPSVPSMVYSKEYTCMTPFYSEDVILTRKDLESKNSDGVSTLLYLQTLYKNDWYHFLERIGCADDQKIWSAKNLQQTRMWASMRAQTLYRTVEGMMFTEKSIRLLSEIEGLTPQTTDVMAKLKFSYVVACQAYSNMKKAGDHKADDIEFLLARFPNLRVAFIETMRVSHRDDALSYYSVLIKHHKDIDEEEKSSASGDLIEVNTTTTKKASSKSKSVIEVYRIKLPGNPILGEGKPENQNHAIIFSRGRYLQAIDMNQAGYFEESLKMRNLLQEFDVTGCKILGFREHIFTGSVSSVANYMALQELSFVTLGQRVLSSPLHIRQHYGHPDLFDKMFVMTEGGMSKASRGINLSEDVFAGFNATIRGHKIDFREYVHVGKGRDVGLQQTYKFEAKLSQGNAEQSLSRDMSRICQRLDFFRLMSFYYGGIGHYMTNTIVMFTLFVVVYIMVSTAVFNEEGVNGRILQPQGVFQLMLAGMGLLQTLPLCATLTVEKGLFPMLKEISYMVISGGPLYFIFHIQTKSFYFQQTILAGGAMYRPTGRGFVIRHSPFDENWRFFASSHIYFGCEILISLVIYGMYTKSHQYWGITWSIWLAVVSFVLGPFWFNPLSFESPKVLEDYNSWMQWMHEPGGSSEQSWRTWWREENAFFKTLSTSARLSLLIFKCSLWLVVAIGLGGRQFMESKAEQERVVEIVSIIILYLLSRHVLHLLEKSCGYASRRLLHYGSSLLTIITLAYLFAHHVHYFRYMVALYYLAAAVSYFLLLVGYNETVMVMFKTHDMIIGHLIFTALLIMSVLQIGYLQTWLLYHNALSSGVVIEDVLKYARRTKETANIEEDQTIDNLRKQLVEQKQMIQQLMETSRSHGQSHVQLQGQGYGQNQDNFGTDSPRSSTSTIPSQALPSLHPTSLTQGQPLTPPHANDPLLGSNVDGKLKSVAKKSYGATSSDYDVVQHVSFQAPKSQSQFSHDVSDDSYVEAPVDNEIRKSKTAGKQGSDIAGSDVASSNVVSPPIKATLAKKKSSDSNLNLLAEKALESNILTQKSSETSLTSSSDFVFSQPTTMPPRL